MLVLSTPTGAAVSARSRGPLKFVTTTPNSALRSHSADPWSGFVPAPKSTRRRIHLTLARPDGGIESVPSSTSSSQPSFGGDETVFVDQENVPLEGVIQFDKPNSSSRIAKWSRVALFAGGDVLALLIFSAIGRFSHGFPVFSLDTLHTADPFVAGWFLSAYFLGGYSEDGRGMNGLSKGVIDATKSWALGIPLGIVIRSATSGHVPQTAFIFVTMGSTGVLLIGFRALLLSILPNSTKKDDVYRRGNPFELFELLTSLVRRW